LNSPFILPPEVPKGGHPIDKDVPEEDNVFYETKDTEYFNPFDCTNLDSEKNPLEVYKAGLIVDNINVKRLTNPKRWCVLPKSLTVIREVPLTVYKNFTFEDLVQEVGHVSWHKSYYYVDKSINLECKTPIAVTQVLSKVEAKSLPRWKPRNRYWDVEFVGSIEIPGTVFCTERDLIKELGLGSKKRKWIRGVKPEIVHQRDVAHTSRDTTGCSILRRHQPPNWTYHSSPDEEQKDIIWNGLESRNQWIYTSLYSIWAGEEAVSDTDAYRERVYWTGPARHFDRDEFFQCYYEPYCHNVVEVEDIEEEAEVEETEDSSVAW